MRLLARSPETVIINAVNNYKLRKMPQGSSWKNAVCYDPAQFAMSGVRDANVRVGGGMMSLAQSVKLPSNWLNALALLW